ncbi:MAG: polysaccharide deacetylase family protein [Burkholderiales bacterium]
MALVACVLAASAHAECGDASGDRPVYLSFDAGHMAIAPQVADVLSRQKVKATFFLADQRTASGGSSLDDEWTPWWAARAAEGHAFGALARTTSPARVCAESTATADRFHQMTGRAMPRLFRLSAGKASPQLIAAAAGCDWVNVAGSVSLGDDVAGRKVTNKQLLHRALRDVRPGDVLLAHLGTWPRRDAWAPTSLEPLIEGLKARGMCFATLREHPAYRAQFSW